MACPRPSGWIVLPGREDQNVLKACCRHRSLSPVGLAGDQNVDPQAGQYESGNTGDIRDTHGDSSHAHRDDGRQPSPLPRTARRPS